MLARRSVTFEVDDLDETYIQAIKEKHGELCVNNNHVRTVEEFGMPKGWTLVHRSSEYLYTSPTNQAEISGYSMRFERV